MKKVFSVLTVAVLAVSTVFAGLSGSASIGVGANFDNGNFGFINQGSGVSLDVELSTLNGEAKGEGEVYASIKGSLGLYWLGDTEDFPVFDGDTAICYAPFGLLAGIEEAKIAGDNWSVSILGMPKVPDYAKSAIDTFVIDDEDDFGRPTGDPLYLPISFKAPYAKTNGVTAEVFGYKVGFGLLGDYGKAETKVNAAVFAETPEYDFNGVTVKAGATYAYNEFEKLDEGTPVVEDPKYKEVNAMGLSAKVGYANDVLSASVATDMGFNFLDGVADKDRVNADVAANFTYDFVSTDVYYNSARKNLVSAKVAFDLNSFDVPVAVAVTAKDLVNKQNLGVKVDVTAIEGLKLTAKGGYEIETKKWNTGLNAEYKNDMLEAKAGFGVASVAEKDAPVILNASASVASEAIIPGAKLGLAWSGADDLLDKDPKKTNYGKIVASVGIEF